MTRILTWLRALERHGAAELVVMIAIGTCLMGAVALMAFALATGVP